MKEENMSFSIPILKIAFSIIASACCLAYASIDLENYLFQHQVTELRLSFNGNEDEGWESLDSPKDFLQIGFDYFGHKVEVSAHKSPDTLLSKTTVEIHGDGKTYVGPIQGKFYEFENDTTSVLGYLTENGGFAGIIEMENVRFYLVQASMYFNDTNMKPKTIVYRDFDIKENKSSICATNQYYIADKKYTLSEFGRKNDSYSHYSNTEYKGGVSEDLSSVRKQISGSDNALVCRVEVIGDVEFYEEVKEDAAQIMYLAIKVADKAFRTTDFGKDVVRLLAWNIKIYKDKNSPDYPFPKSTMKDIGKFLHAFRDNYKKSHNNESCWIFGITGSYLNAAGRAFDKQVCSKNNNNYGVIRYFKNFDLYGTFIHEAGHAFGAPHDPYDNATCQPQGAYNYIMTAHGSHGNNRHKFSPCSIDHIRPVLNDKDVRKCLMKPAPSECGNGFKEEHEECDCGPYEHVCEKIDRCCTPKGGLGDDKECTYRRSKGYTCSDETDGCCTNCTLAVKGKNCFSGNGGCIIGTCDGVSKNCKIKTNARDGTTCINANGGVNTCFSGSCNSSYCRDHNLDVCICTGIFKCRVCCLKDGNCISSEKLGFVPDGISAILSYGTICGYKLQCNGTGYCISPTGKYPTNTGVVVTCISVPLILLVAVVAWAYYYFVIKKKRRFSAMWLCKSVKPTSSHKVLHSSGKHQTMHAHRKLNRGNNH